jgi:hypothetical protein
MGQRCKRVQDDRMEMQEGRAEVGEDGTEDNMYNRMLYERMRWRYERMCERVCCMTRRGCTERIELSDLQED